jgi:hypothetical protein
MITRKNKFERKGEVGETMQQIDRKTVISYRYENEDEANRHEKQMIKDGWFVTLRKSYFQKNYREYAKQQSKGTYL